MPLYLVVIFETVFESMLAVYMLPFLSTAIDDGALPVLPNIVETPVGVIFVTSFDP